MHFTKKVSIDSSGFPYNRSMFKCTQFCIVIIFLAVLPCLCEIDDDDDVDVIELDDENVDDYLSFDEEDLQRLLKEKDTDALLSKLQIDVEKFVKLHDAVVESVNAKGGTVVECLDFLIKYYKRALSAEEEVYMYT
jgi:DNA-directed RNA polymerase subunit H (RpoH/RPB5)